MTFKDDINPNNWPVFDISDIKNDDNGVSLRFLSKEEMLKYRNSPALRIDYFIVDSIGRHLSDWKVTITPSEINRGDEGK
jgi:hypothetical protein